MSSRQLRKLQQQRELERVSLQDTTTTGHGGPDGENEESYDERLDSKPSLFANLAALQADEDQHDESDTSEKGIKDDEDHAGTEQRISTISGKKRKKANKGKKKKNSTKRTDIDTAQLSRPGAQFDGREDEIDLALQELSFNRKRPLTNTDKPSGSPEYERVCALMRINTQNLKVANEMRNLFGRSAIENHDDAGGAVPRGGRRRQRAIQREVNLETALKGQHAPGKGLLELTLRRNAFIQGKDEWPRAPTGGLTIDIDHDEREFTGMIVFRFVHNQAYDIVQRQFNMLVEMGDPQHLIGLLQRNPYNISLLLQVSKIAKDQTDHALSSDLVERALFTFGRSASSIFVTKIAEGKARLEFARPENREFWLAGYQYIKSLMMKGTYRTALEWAKLLLALDPEEDPYCMLLMIHHLALRAFESQYVLDVYENKTLGTWSTYIAYMSPSLALAAMQLKEGARARTLLSQSIQRLPWLFCRLFQDLNLGTPPASIWGAEPRTGAEKLFSEIYIRQTKDLWNTPEATALLVEVAHALDKVNYRLIPLFDDKTITLDVARFAYLDNTPTLMALVPSHLLHRSNNSDSDPLPPDRNLVSWDSQRTFLSGGDNSSGMERAFGDHLDPIAALRALIPALRNGPTGDDEQEITDDEIRDFLNTEANRRRMTEEAATPSSDDDAEEVREVVQPSRLSGARRFYDFLFGSRNEEQVEDTLDEAEPDPELHDA